MVNGCHDPHCDIHSPEADEGLLDLADALAAAAEDSEHWHADICDLCNAVAAYRAARST